MVAVPQAVGEQARWRSRQSISGDKPVLHCDMPMTRDRAARDASHDRAADTICALLDEGKRLRSHLGRPVCVLNLLVCPPARRRAGVRGGNGTRRPSRSVRRRRALGRALCEDDEMLQHHSLRSHGALDAGACRARLMKAGKALLEVRVGCRRRRVAARRQAERCG